MDPRIVFLDKDTTDIGDIDFSAIESIGPVQYFANTSPEQTADRISQAEIVLTNKVYIGAEAMSSAKILKLIQVVATGVNNVDLEAAKQSGIAVCNVSGYSTPAVAQHVFALLLNLVTNVHRYGATKGEWSDSPMFTRLDFPVSELAGKTLGIVGFGEIGKAVAEIGKGFGMTVVALGRDGSSKSDEKIVRLPKEKFFPSCDVISLHCPLTPETHHLINTEVLSRMKNSAILINTGRGDLVNENKLVAALENGEIRAAGLDVISEEPPAKDHLLMKTDLPNLLITPHSAWSSVESRQRLVDGVAENLAVFLKGEKRNRVV